MRRIRGIPPEAQFDERIASTGRVDAELAKLEQRVKRIRAVNRVITVRVEPADR